MEFEDEVVFIYIRISTNAKTYKGAGNLLVYICSLLNFPAGAYRTVSKSGKPYIVRRFFLLMLHLNVPGSNRNTYHLRLQFANKNHGKELFIYYLCLHDPLWPVYYRYRFI